jgi:hypothetical protein
MGDALTRALLLALGAVVAGPFGVMGVAAGLGLRAAFRRN